MSPSFRRRLLREKRNRRGRMVRGTNVQHVIERLEPRAMLAAVPFEPVPAEGATSWLYSPVDGKSYHPLDSRKPAGDLTKLDAIPAMVIPPVGMAPQQTWALPDGSFLALFGSNVGQGEFRRFSADGVQLGWPAALAGRVKDVLQTRDGGFIIWGNVTTLAETAWLRGGFDTSWNGGIDGYVARIDPTGVLQWATLVGGPGHDAVQSVAMSPDGSTLFVVGDTSSSGSFVHGTADQVFDDSISQRRITIGRTPTGGPLEIDVNSQSSDGALPAGYQVSGGPLAGAANCVNGFVMVMAADGSRHIWSSYLTPNDTFYNPSPAGEFRASSASFVTELPDIQVLGGQARTRAGIVVSDAGASAAEGSSLVTLTELPSVRNVNTGILERDFAFTAIESTGLPDIFYTAVRSKPLNAPPDKAYYYYMSLASTLEVDITAEFPFFERPGVPGTPSTRALGRVSFSVGPRGEATVTRDLDLGFSSFSLTGFYPTADAIYVTGTALSAASLGLGERFSGYHTAQWPLTGLAGNNYGDVVVAELDIKGNAVRHQFVGNVNANSVGIKEKGGGIVVLPARDRPGVDVKLFGSRYAQPVNGQRETAVTGGRLWTYYDSTKDKSRSLPSFEAATGTPSLPRPAAPFPPVVGSPASPKLQWTGYVNSTVNDDSITDVWGIPKTAANGLAENLVVLETGVGDSAVRKGAYVATWTPSNWSDGIKGAIAQIQLNSNATKLYAAGVTGTPSWSVSGFDPTLSTWFNTNSDSRRFVSSTDGFFARVDVAQQSLDYATYLGGQGESFIGQSDDRFTPGSNTFSGEDSSHAFYIDPTTSDEGGDVYVVGRSNARSGLGSRDGVTDHPAQERYFSTVRPGELSTWPNGSFDDRKSLPTRAQAYDATIYSLNDKRDGGTSSSQLDWAAYLTPRVPGEITDDNEGPTQAYLIMRSADYVWRAKDASGSGSLIYVFGDDVADVTPASESVVEGRPTQKAIYVFHDTSAADLGVNDLDRLNSVKIKKFVAFQWTKPDQILVAPNQLRADGSADKTSVFFRTTSDIQRIDLPTTASWADPMRDLYVAWSTKALNGLPFNHMAVNGSKIYVASTTSQQQWETIPPLGLEQGGKLRNGPSDAVLMQLNSVTAGALEWWMLQGGDGADQGTAVAAFPDGRVMLFGNTSSRPTDVNELGWVPPSSPATGDTRNMLGNRTLAPSSRSFTGGLTDAFSVTVQTNNVTTPPSKAEAEVGGVVDGVVKPIVAGSTTASSTNGTDFGRVIQGGAKVSRTFRIENRGSEVLTLNVDSLPSWLASDPTKPLPANLGVGQTFDWPLTVNPQFLPLGNLSGTVVISTNDANEGEYSFAVKGEVIVPPPSTTSVTVSPSQVAEGNVSSATTPVTFTVRFAPGTPAPTFPVSVGYKLVGVTATEGEDFVGATGTLTFASATDLVKTVEARVKGDVEPEAAETFKLVLQSPSQGVIEAGAGEAVVTITNDDGPVIPPTVGFAPAAYRITEGGRGASTSVPINVRLSKIQPQDVVVTYATANLTASSGSDYTAKSGTLTIPKGKTEASFDVVVLGDVLGEEDESFVIRLTGATGVAGVTLTPALATVTIVNDDGPRPLPPVTVSKATVNEGNSGVARLTFTITLAKAMATATTLNYTTVDGTAKAGKDYTAASGQVTIPAGRTSVTVTVNVITNRIVDGNRTLSLQVRNGTTLLATGVGTILDDDRPAVKAAFASLGAKMPVSGSK